MYLTFSQSSSLPLRARSTARSYDARQKMILTKEILFIYLIGNVDQKVTKIVFIHNYAKIEKSKNFWKFSIFTYFSTKSIFACVLSYSSN